MTPKGKKKLKQLNKELMAAREELSSRIKDVDKQDIFTSAKEQLKLERQALKTKIKGLRDTPRPQMKAELKKVEAEIKLTKDQLDRSAFEQIKDNLVDQETNWQRDVFPYEPRKDVPDNEVLLTKDQEIAALDKEITEIEADLATRTDDTFEKTTNPDIVAEREAIRVDEVRHNAVLEGINCMAQFGAQ